jgi:hypothetical protein
MSKKGRKTKLTKGVLDRLRKCKSKGYTDSTLASIACVTAETFGNWKTKSLTAKRGIFFEFFDLYEELQAQEQKIIVDSTFAEAKGGNMKAVELAMKRHPRLRQVFKEEVQKAETEHKGKIIIEVPPELKELFEK